MLFTAIAIALPFALVLATEGALRSAGVGEARRAPFQPVPGHEDYVAMSPEYGGMYFRGFRPGVAYDPLATPKAEGAFRVLALGGSTTAGFPYRWYYGFPARLEDRLAAALPGRRVEVANLGMTATNSYTVWALTEPVIRQQPDAVVLYSGHNEFYGAYGTGGTQGWGGTSVSFKRALIRASRWAVVAGPVALIADEEAAGEESRTLMARVVRDAAILAESEAFRGAVEQYEANLRDALAAYEAAGIPVFLATLTSNLAGQAPLGDEPEAASAFARGHRLLVAGDSLAARDAFMEAKEADGLRFRAPEVLNEVVRKLGDAFSNVTVVDVQEAFRTASPGQVEGAALFADHLHPNARGYALMADAFAEAMRASLPAMRGVPVLEPAPAALDPVEEPTAALQLAVLTGGYPFRKDRTPRQASAAARAQADSMASTGRYGSVLAVQTLLDGLPTETALKSAIREARAASDTLSALRLYGALLRWRPFDAALAAQAVGLGLASARYDAETAALARYAASHVPSPSMLNVQAALALRNRDLDRAEALLVAAERADSTSQEMLFNRARLLVMRGDTAGARAYFERFRAAGPAR